MFIQQLYIYSTILPTLIKFQSATGESHHLILLRILVTCVSLPYFSVEWFNNFLFFVIANLADDSILLIGVLRSVVVREGQNGLKPPFKY